MYDRLSNSRQPRQPWPATCRLLPTASITIPVKSNSGDDIKGILRYPLREDETASQFDGCHTPFESSVECTFVTKHPILALLGMVTFVTGLKSTLLVASACPNTRSQQEQLKWYRHIVLSPSKSRYLMLPASYVRTINHFGHKNTPISLTLLPTFPLEHLCHTRSSLISSKSQS